MKAKILLLTLATLTISSCASLRSVSLTQVPAGRDHPVEASASSWGILGLYGNNDFVDEAIEKLRDQCPGGKVSGVFTKYEGMSYVLWTTRTINAKAYCEGGKST